MISEGYNIYLRPNYQNKMHVNWGECSTEWSIIKKRKQILYSFYSFMCALFRKYGRGGVCKGRDAKISEGK